VATGLGTKGSARGDTAEVGRFTERRRRNRRRAELFQGAGLSHSHSTASLSFAKRSGGLLGRCPVRPKS
jgi:hypothetical protein